jgi:hypothetical protein
LANSAVFLMFSFVKVLEIFPIYFLGEISCVILVSTDCLCEKSQ